MVTLTTSHGGLCGAAEKDVRDWVRTAQEGAESLLTLLDLMTQPESGYRGAED